MAWIDELAPGQRKLRHGPVPEELKREAVVAVASGRPESREAAAELGVQDATVREWKRQMLAKSEEATVSGSGKRRTVVESKEPSVKPTVAPNASDAAGPADALASMERKVAELQARLDELDADVDRQRREKRELDIEIAIRKGVIELLGKEPGAVPENLTSREKTILVKTAGETLGVTARSLLPVVGIARSTYHYQLKSMKRPDKDAPLLELVREAFENSERRYGYKRIHLELKSMGVRVSAKRIMRLMTSHGLVPLFKSAKRYSSYKGELTKAPKNLVNRDFHAERPNMLWVTDLTEFSIPAGKAYLSPVIDCYDGMPVAWTIGTSPNAELANGMLADACSTLKDGEKPIIHSDRGCHYRWPEWIRICTDNNLTRSMSAKGCSPDNAAAEGFLGRPRQEFFRKRSFAGVSMDGFINMLDDYMVRYRDKRIKTESGHGHHGSSTRARSCGMIGGDGINDESNKTAPAPTRNTDLTKNTRKKHASVPAAYLRWRSRSIRSTSVCSSCSTQSRKMEQNESGLPSTCHASRPRAYDRPASYLMATGRYPFRSSTKLSSWRPVRPLPSMNGWMFSNIAWKPAALSSGCAAQPSNPSIKDRRSSRISSGSAVLTRVAVIRAK